MDSVDRDFIQRMSTSLLRFKERGDDYNFRCPYCGDSRKSESKARGWLLYDKERGSYGFHCYNCSKSTSLKEFIEENKPGILQEYVAAKFKGSRPSIESSRSVKRALTKKPVFRKSDPVPVLGPPLLRFPEVKRSKEVDWALEYLASRAVPFHELDNIFCCEDIREISKNIEAYKETKFRAAKCIVFPFYGTSGEIAYLQARMLEGSLRYMTFEVGGGGKLWGRHRIEAGHQISLFEGVLDAILVKNGVASAGVDLLRAANLLKEEYPDHKIRLCYDDDWRRNYQVYEQVKRASKLGYNLCLVSSQYKDVNDMVTKGGMSSEEVERLLDEYTLTPLQSGLEIARVKKPWKQ